MSLTAKKKHIFFDNRIAYNLLCEYLSSIYFLEKEILEKDLW